MEVEGELLNSDPNQQVNPTQEPSELEESLAYTPAAKPQKVFPLDMIDSSLLIENYEHSLRRHKKNIETREWEIVHNKDGSIVKPLLNEEGIYAVTEILKMALDQISKTGNIDNRKYHEIVRTYGLTIVDDLTFFCEQWDLSDEFYANHITNIFLNVIDSSLSHARNGGIINTMRETINRTIVTNRTETPEEPNINPFG